VNKLVLVALFLTALFLARAAFAEDSPDFQVEVNPHVYPAGEFARKGVKAGNLPEMMKRPDALPERGEREAVFARVPGLAQDVAGMDELDRDLLLVRARTKSAEELRKLYPKIGGKRLARLRAESRK
jgi:hypothetical protein